MKQALVVWGGLELHEPEAGAQLVRQLLEAEGFDVVVSNDYTALGDAAGMDLVVPLITGGELAREPTQRLVEAIHGGTGLAGFHHGLATTFPGNMHFRFMTGATFAGHPGNIITYRVDIERPDDPLVAGIGSFEHTSEQYYLHYDPAIEVLATTTFSGEHAPWRKGVKMPVVFRTDHGAGRVFYSALGHKPAELEVPQIRTILRRGLLWAAR
jgi:hypothetical protein